MMKKVSILVFGLVLITIWGFCFLNYEQANAYTAAMGLSFTILSVYFFQKRFNFELNLPDKILLLALPILYSTTLYIQLFPSIKGKFELLHLLFYIHIVNPVNIGLLVLLLGLTKLKELSKPVNIFIFLYLILFYVHFLYPDWRGIQFISITEDFDTEMSNDAKAQKENISQVNYSENLSKFSFINSTLDTINLPTHSTKYILLETWNETCLPCVKAMKELPDFYKSIQNKVEVYYLYEHQKEHVRRKFEKIFNFKNIEDKSKILIDINEELYKALNMKGYPYFLLFDSQGNLRYHSRGYIGKEALSKQVLEHI